MKEIDWKQEAQKHAAAAGEIKIALAGRLEEVRTQIAVLGQMQLLEDNDLDQVMLGWKIEQLKEQERWLEGMLYGKQRTETGTADH